jgi:adenylate cyclase
LDWVVDEFEGPLHGLLLAELYATDQDIALPPWTGQEVTGDPAYSNEHLSLLDKP